MILRFQIPEKKDYACIAELVNAAQEPFRKLDSAENIELETAETIANTAIRRELLCAYHRTKVVGYTAFRQKNPSTIWISSLFVDPACQGKGIGKNLLKEVEQWGRTQHAQVLALETDQRASWACGFYLHEGYQILSDEDMASPPWDHILDTSQVPGRFVFGKML